MENVIYLKGNLVNGIIETEMPFQEIADLVSKEKKILVIKNLFSSNEMHELTESVYNWGRIVPPVTQDDFKGNYHSIKAKVSNIQQVPHVFHDYNFNNFNTLPNDLKEKLNNVFESLRVFYNALTNYDAPFGYVQNAPYIHPQLIQYPRGGGFFGRHNHNLLPQKIGFILAMSKFGEDYTGGGTCFVVNDKLIDMELKQDIGDLCLWPNDIDHWVKQSPLDDQFTWESEKGRWVATLAYFNPY